MEQVDILTPPHFRKSGITKTREQAITNGDWLGGFHLWIIQTKPELAILYQIRSVNKPTWPGKLDVTAAGHYMAGETVKDGLREVREEIGRDYDFENLTYLGKKVFVGLDKHKRKLQTVCDVFFLIDNSSLEDYRLQHEEVAGLVIIKVSDILKTFTQKHYQFESEMIDIEGKRSHRQFDYQDFIENWDNYQYKIALLAERFVKGEKDLFY